MKKSEYLSKYGLIKEDHLVFVTDSKNRILDEFNRLNEMGIKHLNIVKFKD